MTTVAVGYLHDDPVAEFYDRHPYPPPVAHFDAQTAGEHDSYAERVEHHRVWPERAPDSVTTVLIAGCGTSQAVHHAVRRPSARVVAVDVSAAAVWHTRELATRHGVTNLVAHRLPVERVHELGQRFDHVVCTGVLHHLADPALGLSRLSEVLAPGGALTLMVYARYGRTGVSLLQEYCRRLGITSSEDELADLVATLREIPLGHPLSRLLRESRDFYNDDALADALLNPRERAYSVPETFDLLAHAGLRFGRWVHQAPYLPGCGSVGETPHAARIAALPLADQFAAVELFRGTITRHAMVAYAATDPLSGHLDFSDPDLRRWRPIRVPSATVVEERTPPGAAAALLNRAHTCTDLVMFVTVSELEMFRRIDGERSISDLGAEAMPFVERLFRHDLVVIDASGEVRP
ncbi:class I SAM-dependent methyltransferase [Phytoactinopolyspora endophytica]|uniref:class I SAM-dependent methyltransferase n=1 Tax=Phytoactinopolyspora endophytica TaxID=1642495 RepID=UPI00101CCF99|nr:class I SAM-dependent methyltransferase [Phytoactinopolyspora endophytica]